MSIELYTKHLCLHAMDEGELTELISKQTADSEKKRLTLCLELLQREPENGGWYTVWSILEKKSKKSVGWLQLNGRPKNGRAEVSCAMIPAKENEKMAAQAMQRITKWAFFNDKRLYSVSTWLSDDNARATEILESAGFIQSFEADGIVHYEKKRPHVPFLALCMMLFTAVSFLPGFLFGNYALWVTIGIVAGVFPGALLESLAYRLREKRIGKGSFRKSPAKKALKNTKMH